MRFLIVIISLYGSFANAAVQDFNSLVKEASIQQKIIHKKLLQSIQNTKVLVASNEVQEGEFAENPEDIKVRLVRAN
ncbi:hypothetical protein [Bdellovibrio reynosensis]|uniref:Uncharacterized protein n=1 Tax=Bdellovibrio reynosensis TaxID=2835041 RepID=A0ABY4C4D5_9BACT|nr:hypothetical protein [Bdellovibrio reynosensis]UOE99824.1 hypothetical protein MNR06_08960 [Bdellovibrio reynosensis]